jgi:hypothetical protein
MFFFHFFQVGTSNYLTIIFQVPDGVQIKDEQVHDHVEWNQWTRFVSYCLDILIFK